MASVLPEQERSAWIMAQRPPVRAVLDPFKPHSFFLERERSRSGLIFDSAAILLTNRECPWRCLMCDLWKHTLTQTIAPGAIPTQIDYALARLARTPEQIKLYNSGSFFDPAAIPVGDYRAIARSIAFAKNILVESHPRLVGEKAMRLRDLLPASLEVAMGLETVHPEVFPRLNKRFELRHFAQAAAFLRQAEIAVRVFLLVKPPFLNEEEALEWTLRSAEFAFSCGATVVSLIPTRSGNGALERLMVSGEFSPPTISMLERAQELVLSLSSGLVFADTWDLDQFSGCECLPERRRRLLQINLTQKLLPPVRCSLCGQSYDLVEKLQ